MVHVRFRSGRLAALLGLAASVSCQAAQERAAPIRELGAVRFARDLDVVLAARPQKPIFLQFQEIPG